MAIQKRRRNSVRPRRLTIDILESRCLLTGVISGTIFNDLDGDGRNDPNEPGMGGISVWLDSGTDSEDLRVVTDSNGNYSFTDLPDGFHSLLMGPKSGFEAGVYRIGAIISEQNPVHTIDFSQQASSSPGFGQVSGRVFFDADSRGELPYRNVDLPPVGEQVVYADTNFNGQRDAGEVFDVTDSDGHYVLREIPAGDQTIRLEPQGEWTATTPNSNNFFVGFSEFSVAYHEEFVDFGVFKVDDTDYGNQTRSVRGNIYDDLNGDGLRNAEELLLSDWTVYADLNANGVRDESEPSGVTSEFGFFHIANVPFGSQRIRVELQDGWTTGHDGVEIDRESNPVDVSLGVGRFTTVRGVVYEDTNQNGVRDPGEQGLAGYRIADFFREQDDAAPIRESFTDANGAYELIRTMAGTTEVPRTASLQVLAGVPLGPRSISTVTSYNAEDSLNWQLREGQIEEIDFGVVEELPANPSTWELRNQWHQTELCHVDSQSQNIVHIGGGCSFGGRTWNFIPVGPDRVLLQNERSTDFLTAFDGDVIAQPTVSAESYWTMITHPDGALSFRNDTNGLYLDGDSEEEGFDVGFSSEIGVDDRWIISTTSVGRQTSSTRFGAIGDYGAVNSATDDLVNWLDHTNLDFVAGLGDGRYPNHTYDDLNGLLCEYMVGATPGTNCPSGGDAEFNRFFPAPGNHDYDGPAGITSFEDYFTLPGAAGANSEHPTGSERYYDVSFQNVDLFILDTEAMLTDSTEFATQRDWLEAAASSSDRPWQVAVMHHAPYGSSSVHGSHESLQFPFAEWGIDMVLSGHDHLYERVERDGTTFVVNGLGSTNLYDFGETIRGSEYRYNDSPGISLFEATSTELTGSLLTSDGHTLDQFQLEHSCNSRVVSRVAVDTLDNETGRSLILDGSESISCGVTYDWSFLTVPDGSDPTIVDNGKPVASFVPDVPGAYQVQLTVSDGDRSESIWRWYLVGQGDGGGGNDGPQDGEIWTLRNRAISDRYLSNADDNNAELSLSDGSTSQWIVSHNGAGIVLENAETGRYLAAADYEASTVTTINGNARWTIINNDDGSISLQNVATRRFLDGDGEGEGFNVDESLSIGDDDGWFVTSTDGGGGNGGGGAADEIWILGNRVFTDTYIRESDSHNAMLSTSAGSMSQWLKMTTDSGVLFQNRVTGRYLATVGEYDIETSSTIVPGAYWTIVTNSDGSISLQNNVTQKFADGDGSSEGSDVDQSTELLEDDGWFVTVVGDINEIWTLRNRAIDDRYIYASDDHDARLALTAGSRSQWIAATNDNGTTLRNLVTREYLVADNYEVGTSAIITPATYWTVVENSDGSIALRNNETMRYVDGDGGSEGWDVDESSMILFDDGWFVDVLATDNMGGSNLGHGLDIRGATIPPGSLAPLDALLVINELGSRSMIDESGEIISNDAFPLDYDGNDFITPLDALLVINSLPSSSASRSASSNVPDFVQKDEESVDNLHRINHIVDAIWGNDEVF